MKIAIVSTLWEPASYTSTGGTGAIVGYLTEELVKRGHKVSLFASGNSITSAKLEAITDSHFIESLYSEPLEYLNIANAFQKGEKFDIIHCNADYRSLFFSSLTKTPSLHAVQYGEIFDHEKKIFEFYKNANYITVSKHMKTLMKINWQGHIYHGIQLDKFPYNEKKDNYLLFLARMSPQKAPHIAIQTAKKLGMNLILAGKKSSSDEKYLKEKVEPFIDNKQIKYVGEANFEEKLKLFKNAKCLLHPLASSYIEAFGLALIEAMACGTPVCAFNKGAISEVIKDGKTGFIVNTAKEMAEAVKNIDKISNKACRKRVENYFTVGKMADGYEKIYQKLIKKDRQGLGK